MNKRIGKAKVGVLATLLLLASCGGGGASAGAMPSEAPAVAATAPAAVVVSSPAASASIVDVTSGTWTGSCEAGATINVTAVTSGISATGSCSAAGVLSLSATYSGKWGVRTLSITQSTAGGTSAATTHSIYYYPVGYTLYVPVQGDGGSNNTSRVYQFSFNSSTNAVDGSTTNLDLTADLGTNSIRAFTMLSDGRFLAGGGGNNWIAFNDDLSTSSKTTYTMTGTPLGSTHGICQMTTTDGSISFIAGRYGGAPAGDINQYTISASNAPFTRDFGQANLAGNNGALASCVALSSTQVIWVDYGADTDSDGALVLSTLSGGTWSETTRLNVDTIVGGAVSSLFAIVLHSNGNLYAFPQNDLAGAGNKQVIRCSSVATSGISAGTCLQIGSNLTGNYIQAAVEIPGHSDLLYLSSNSAAGVSNDNRLFRYSLTTGNATLVQDLDSTTTGALANTEQWGLRYMGIK